jgi:hypothetical protein
LEHRTFEYEREIGVVREESKRKVYAFNNIIKGLEQALKT